MADPQLGGTSTPPGGTDTSKKARHTKRGQSRQPAPSSTSTGAGTHDPINLAPVVYKNGPFKLPTDQWDFRVWGRRPDSKVVAMNEIETMSWDDASALMTGQIQFYESSVAKSIGLTDGGQITCETRGRTGGWKPVWTMRVYSPGKDFGTKQRTFSLANELQRLQDSTDNFSFKKSKDRPKGWRTDEIIKFVFDTYQIEIAPGGLPKMTAYVKNWILVNQAPLDVVHSALLREKNVTGRKYALGLDGLGRAVVTPYRRPSMLYEFGVSALAAAFALARRARFATAVTVRADPEVTVGTTSKNRRTKKVTKVLSQVVSQAGVATWGYVHRNVYSPDAPTNDKATEEGQLFLASVARGDRQIQVTMPGMPTLRRLDAIRFVLPDEGLKQLVYVTEAHHNVDGTQYTTDAVLNYDDPFVDRKADLIANKLSDTAVQRTRVTPTPAKAATTPSPTRNKGRSNGDPQLGGTPTSPNKAATRTGRGKPLQ